ncbi:protein-arginine deiminase family protein [Actinoplanes sp. HUAS TT8]|uniref:protein-arginine deiminase family protein n=1 Tax=Actinoplanes sp. HUAS TT8 TaxID=3447453 RepID=UPI003F523A3F
MRRILFVPVVLVLAAVPITAYAGESDGPELTVRTPGEVFLANIDDDAGKCRAPARKIAKAAVAREEDNSTRYYQIDDPTLAQRKEYRDEQTLADRQLAACNDASDEIVNGARDEQDLARLHASFTSSPDGATAQVITTGDVRVFVKRQGWEVATTLTTDELRHGVELGVEGRDVVRDRAVWDGTATVTLRVTSKNRIKSADVRLREAPIRTQLNTRPLERVLAATADDANGKAWRAATAAVLPDGVPMSLIDTTDPTDDWMQDLFEPAYQVMNGHAMRVLITSPNQAHRQADRIVYTQLRGPDIGAVFIPTTPVDGVDDLNTYDSMGNLETVPDGRVVLGGKPAPELVTFLKAQGTTVTIVDSAWLEVGHVDEFLQFVPVGDSWKVIVADPSAGVALLSTVPAGTRLHGNLPDLGDVAGRIDQRTVGEFRADEQFLDTNRIAARKIDAAIAALGLPASRVVRIPMLYGARGFDWGLLQSEIDSLPPGPERDKAVAAQAALRNAGAETPNPVNGLLAGAGRYVAPKPFGPIVGGRDIFATAISEVMRGIGYKVTYVDDLTSAHVSLGEIHCSTNTFRTIP